jgi:Ribonuclease G/E
MNPSETYQGTGLDGEREDDDAIVVTVEQISEIMRLQKLRALQGIVVVDCTNVDF